MRRCSNPEILVSSTSSRHADCALLLGHSPDLQAVADIVGNAHVRKKRVGLKYHADVTLLDRHRCHVFAIERYPAAGIGQLEPCDNPQHGRLAATGRPEQNQRFAAGNVERRRLQRAGTIGEGLAACLDADRRAVPCHRLHLACSLSANICMATSSGMIITKKISV